jgi:hypothetical protein
MTPHQNARKKAKSTDTRSENSLIPSLATQNQDQSKVNVVVA